MSDPYDFLDKPSAPSNTDPYSFLDEAATGAAPETSAIRRLVADPTISLAKGVVRAGEGVVGLAGLVSGGHAGKSLNELTGYDPKATHAFLDEYTSDAQKAANAKHQRQNKTLLLHGATDRHPRGSYSAH